MLSRRAMLAGGLLGGLGLRAARADAPTIRLGSLPFGTSTWEAAVIKARGLDAANGFQLDAVKLAGNDAARISFIGGQVDTIIGDLLWAARLGNDGQAVRFIPYSTSEGGVMVPPGSAVKSLKDLAGKRLGVAGGPLDKNWLLLRAQAKDAAGIDLERDAEIAYGAPPLITLKLEQGALDAALTYWTYCARLTAKGYRQLVGAEDIMHALGVPGDVALIGYLFQDATVKEKPAAVAAFERPSATPRTTPRDMATVKEIATRSSVIPTLCPRSPRSASCTMKRSTAIGAGNRREPASRAASCQAPMSTARDARRVSAPIPSRHARSPPRMPAARAPQPLRPV